LYVSSAVYKSNSQQFHPQLRTLVRKPSAWLYLYTTHAVMYHKTFTSWSTDP